MTSDHITVNKSTYESLQQELVELRQTVDNLTKAQLLIPVEYKHEQMNSFLEYTPAAIAIFDRQMHYLLVSRRWREDYGLADKDIIGHSHYEIFPDIPQHWLEIYQRCLAGAFEQCEEDCFFRANGQIEWIKWEIRPWYQKANEIGGIIIFTELITTRKQAEIALADSERRLKDIATNLPGAIFQFTNRNDVWKVDYISEFIWELAGITANEMMQDINSFIALIHPEDINNYIASVIEAINNCTSWHYEGRLVKPDGKTHWWQGDSTPTINEQGEIIFCGVLLDITARKQAEEALKKLNEELEFKVEERTAALRQSEARLQRLADNVPGMMYEFHLSTDDQMSFPYVSSGCRELLELEPEQIQKDGLLIFNCIHLDDINEIKAGIFHSAKTLENYQAEWRINTNSNYQKWVKAIAKPEYQSDNTVLWYGCLFDITELKQAEIALQQQAYNLEKTLLDLKQAQMKLIHSEKMSSLGNMVAGIAHEINNPVNFIHGNISPANEYVQDLLNLLELYEKHFPKPPKEIQEKINNIELEFLKSDVVKLLNSMSIGTDRIREIVLSLRNFSRLDETELKSVNIHEGIDSTLMILHHRLKAQPKYLEISIIKKYGDLPLIQCYPGQLNQVFMNILSNAIDALEDTNLVNRKREIHIITEKINNYRLTIRILDNGLGISSEIISKLFDPFFTTKDIGKGTGLGLSISYQIIVDRHHGNLYCHSTLGQGAEFVIEIPIHQSQANK